MKWARVGFPWIVSAVVLTVLFAVLGRENAEGELHWQSPRKEPMRVRLVALALAYPRSSFFSNEEVFIASKQLGKEESRLIKLIYRFLPYQPPLSEYGLDYSTVHEIHALRDPSCDETLRQMSSPQYMPQWPQTDQSWKYSTDSPTLDAGRRRARLPCDQTTADDYDKSTHEPANDHDQP